MGGPEPLFPLGKGVNLPLFGGIQIDVQRAARVELRAGRPGGRPLLPDDAGGLLPFLYGGLIPFPTVLSGGFLLLLGVLLRYLRLPAGELCLIFLLLPGAFGLTYRPVSPGGGPGQRHGGADHGGGGAGDGHQRTSLCQMLSVCCAPRRR